MHPEKLGPYRIERQLGRGGMGAVYVGVNEETGERAAVKVLAPAFAAEPNFRGRFATEIETLKMLRHPNIVQLYGFGEEHGTLFYAMQLVEGSNLEVEVRRGRHFDWREVLSIGLDVCKALKHAHDRGVIHRDLKPANLLRSADDRILLSDFGIAKLFGGAEFTAAGGVIGTADYMAPEQAAGEGVSPRSDLYSLGASLFCLLAGRPPFQGRSIPDIIHQVRYVDAPLVGRFAPTTPVELENILARLLEKDPKKRIPTALALSNLLHSMANVAPPTMTDEPLAEESAGLSHEFTLATQTPTGGAGVDDASATHVAPGAARPAQSGVTGSQLETLVHTAPAGAARESNQAASEATAIEEPPRHFTPVSETELGRIETHQGSHDAEHFDWLKIALAATALAVLCLVGWYATRPLSADQLYTKIRETVETQDLAAAERAIASFLERFPVDERRNEIEEYRNALEVARLERTLERRSRRGRPGEGMSLVEQTYLDAMQTAQSDPSRAARQLESLVRVFGPGAADDAANAAYVDLARKQAEQLREGAEKLAEEHRTALAARLAAAEKLQHEDPAAARSIWQGIVDLYAAQSWAEPLVDEARKHLADSAP